MMENIYYEYFEMWNWPVVVVDAAEKYRIEMIAWYSKRNHIYISTQFKNVMM